ncbi:hypothetical protein [Marinibactrum halimedae]|uniref:Uncharacterized protein n=1 Tax=Marinibactrum halimedae TaxID=1444977 RepID=A0AA37T3B5_9GAMM|nr:hypothetical protein [Marinibactrum halimedae]MCD9459060.1 hypothetical protein [Marinibactrum halimedae]GLS24661.1 hypothetical protein GCM10007877_03750 [Marinibactrum halimedae]
MNNDELNGVAAMDMEAILNKSQKILAEVQEALIKSEYRQAVLDANIQSTWACSRYQWVEKINAEFGQPNESEIFFAHKEFKEKFLKEKTVKSSFMSPFFVNNPI